MATKTKAYVDTAAFISFLDVSDSYHHLFKQLFNRPPMLLTTSLVVAEGHGWFLRRYDVYRATQFLNFISCIEDLKIESVGEKEITASTPIIKKFNDQKLTLADAIGLSLMKRDKITLCWSTDKHMALEGARLVIYETS